MIRRPPRSTLDRSSAASDVYKRQLCYMDSRCPEIGGAQIHLPWDRRGDQIAQSGLGHGGKHRNIRLIHGSCQAGPGRDRSLFLDSLLADQSMEQSHKPPGGTGHSCPLPHTPAISSVAYTRGAAGSWSSASRLVFAYTPRRRWRPTGSQRRRPTDVHTATTTHLNFVQV